MAWNGGWLHQPCLPLRLLPRSMGEFCFEAKGRSQGCAFGHTADAWAAGSPAARVATTSWLGGDLLQLGLPLRCLYEGQYREQGGETFGSGGACAVTPSLAGVSMIDWEKP